MKRVSWKSRLQKLVIAALVGLVAYFALTDESGSFDVPGSADLGLQRIEHGFGSMADAVTHRIDEDNHSMQKVHDDYEKHTAERVEASGGKAP